MKTLALAACLLYSAAAIRADERRMVTLDQIVEALR